MSSASLLRDGVLPARAPPGSYSSRRRREGASGPFLNSTGDVSLLPILLAAASEGGPSPSDDEMRAMADRVGMASIFGI